MQGGDVRRFGRSDEVVELDRSAEQHGDEDFEECVEANASPTSEASRMRPNAQGNKAPVLSRGYGNDANAVSDEGDEFEEIYRAGAT